MATDRVLYYMVCPLCCMNMTISGVSLFYTHQAFLIARFSTSLVDMHKPLIVHSSIPFLLALRSNKLVVVAQLLPLPWLIPLLKLLSDGWACKCARDSPTRGNFESVIPTGQKTSTINRPLDHVLINGGAFLCVQT